MKKQIITVLVNRGYKAEECAVVKNGVEKNGIKIMNDTNIAPVIYTDGMSGTAEEIADKVIEIYENNKTPQLDTKEITSPKFIMDNVFVGVQRLHGKADYIHRASRYNDIEEYLYVRISDEMTFKVTQQMLDKISSDTELLVTEDELFDLAYAHTFADYKLKSLSEMLGMPGFDLPMYVLTNKSGHLGASQLLNSKAIEEFANLMNVDTVYIIPSSIHEVLLIADDGNQDIEMLSEMVKSVNSQEVEPVDQLGDNAILWIR